MERRLNGLVHTDVMIKEALILSGCLYLEYESVGGVRCLFRHPGGIIQCGSEASINRGTMISTIES